MSAYQAFQYLAAVLSGLMFIVAIVACFYVEDSVYDYE